jgi:hypothetical protein
VRRPIEAPRPGRTLVTLDADVYERARSDLGDLRIVDDGGGHAPYLLLRMDDARPSAALQPVTLNEGSVRGQGATITLDFGRPTRKTGLALSLPGDNFRRRVKVEGRGRRDREWTTLTEGAYVFAIPGPPPARYETLSLPANDFELLRVTVFRGEGDPPGLRIRKAWALSDDRRLPREAPIPHGRIARAEDGRRQETVLSIDLPARAQPFAALVLDVGDGRFFREAVVEARREIPPRDAHAAAQAYWVEVASAAIYRYDEGTRMHERLRVDACGRERRLRLRVRNRDDRPLDVRGVTVLGPVEQVVFEARPGRRYALEYGLPGRSRPSYDLARTTRDSHAFAAEAAPAALGAPAPVSPDASRPPWTERHPALLWTGLVASVLALAALTWRALRAAA